MLWDQDIISALFFSFLNNLNDVALQTVLYNCTANFRFPGGKEPSSACASLMRGLMELPLVTR
jgi:hypothetical protein